MTDRGNGEHSFLLVSPSIPHANYNRTKHQTTKETHTMSLLLGGRGARSAVSLLGKRQNVSTALLANGWFPEWFPSLPFTATQFPNSNTPSGYSHEGVTRSHIVSDFIVAQSILDHVSLPQNHLRNALVSLEQSLETIEWNQDVMERMEEKEEELSSLGLWLISTLKRRKKKMNKHKLQKRRKKLRLKSKK